MDNMTRSAPKLRDPFAPFQPSVYDRASVNALVHKNIDAVKTAMSKKIVSSVSFGTVLPQTEGKSEVLITNILHAILVKFLQSYKYAPNPEEPEVAELNLCRRTILVELEKPLQSVSALRQVIEALSDLEELEKREAAREMESLMETTSDGITYLHQYQYRPEDQLPEKTPSRHKDTVLPDDDEKKSRKPKGTGQLGEYLKPSPLFPPLQQPIYQPIQQGTVVTPLRGQVIIIESSSESEYDSENYDSEELRRWGKRRKTGKAATNTSCIESTTKRIFTTPITNPSSKKPVARKPLPNKKEYGSEELEPWGMTRAELATRTTDNIKNVEELRERQALRNRSIFPTSWPVGPTSMGPAQVPENPGGLLDISYLPSFSVSSSVKRDSDPEKQIRSTTGYSARPVSKPQADRIAVSLPPSTRTTPMVEAATLAQPLSNSLKTRRTEDAPISLSPIGKHHLPEKTVTSPPISDGLENAPARNVATPPTASESNTSETLQEKKAATLPSTVDPDEPPQLGESSMDTGPPEGTSKVIKTEPGTVTSPLSDTPEPVRPPSPPRPALRRSRRSTQARTAATPIVRRRRKRA